jgi:hypothetical protein
MRSKEFINEGWKFPLAGGILGGLIGGPVGAVAGAGLFWYAQQSNERLYQQRKLGPVYKVYFDNNDLFPNKTYNIDQAHEIIKDLAVKPHDIDKWFSVVNTKTGKVEFKYKNNDTWSNLFPDSSYGGSHVWGADVPADVPADISQRLPSKTSNIRAKVPSAQYKNVNFFTQEFINQVEDLAKSKNWDIIKVADYLQELVNSKKYNFGHRADWIKLQSMIPNSYDNDSLRILGKNLKQEFQKSKQYYIDRITGIRK